MTDPHEAKYKEMQKYVPFIQRVIEKLKVNNDHLQADSPRKAQLQKMEMLYDLLTNKHKKIKIETLIKCESVLIKLQAKIEKNEDAILNDVSLKHPASDKSNIKDTKDLQDITGPASPPPEVIADDYIEQPVVIPTERRSSPTISAKNTAAEKSTHLQHSRNSKSDPFQSLRRNFFDIDCKPVVNSASPESPLHQTHFTAPKSSLHDYHHGKPLKQHKDFNPSAKERNSEDSKSAKADDKKLQTVKVVITEPLTANFTKQHFPPTSKFLPRSSSSSVCHSNLRRLPPATCQTKLEANEEAYSPEELWDQYNESANKQNKNANTSSGAAAANVFSRLGAKVSDDSPKSRTSGRYTPIPDVLKSPPLSANDINKLLLESGADKTLNDISEIGTRRPPKIEEPPVNVSPSNTLEFVRKKLAQTAKLNSPKREKDEVHVSTLPPERIALKYNPHPRQERLQSVSSTEGSECSSTHSKICNDPRIKMPLSFTQHSPSQVAAANVNVLPAINLSDPRLKRQTAPAQERKPLLATPPSLAFATSTPPTMSYSNQSPNIYSRRIDPRISRMGNSTAAPTLATPIRRMSTSQPEYSSEENWDTDEEDVKEKDKGKGKEKPANKSDGHLEQMNKPKNDGKYERICTIELDQGFEGNRTLPRRDPFNSSHLAKIPAENYAAGSAAASVSNNKFVPPFRNNNLKAIPQRQEQSLGGKMETPKNPKNKLIPASTFLVPNAPKSDTEEDWDSEPEMKNVKPKTLINEVPLACSSPMSSSSSANSFHGQISPKPFLGTKPMPAGHLAHMPHMSHMPHIPHTPHIPHIQTHFPPAAAANSHQSFRMQTAHPPPKNRFNSLLNDTSERAKYLEAKKQKSIEPRTYKEFREAKERERERQRAEEAAEAQRRANETKGERSETAAATGQSVNAEKVKKEGFRKSEDNNNKKDRKSSQKEVNKSVAGESTLDKMYRTQNFNTSFPKASTSFKIPKKKTEEQIKEEEAVAERLATEEKMQENLKAINNKEAAIAHTKFIKQEGNKFNNRKHLETATKQQDKTKSNEETITPATTEGSQQIVSLERPKPMADKTKVKQEGKSCTKGNKHRNQVENLDNSGKQQEKTKEKCPIQTSGESGQEKDAVELPKPIKYEMKDKTDQRTIKAEEISVGKQKEKENTEQETEEQEMEQEKEQEKYSNESHPDEEEEEQEHLPAHAAALEDINVNKRDPRCRTKTTNSAQPATEDAEEEEEEEKLNSLNGIMITPSQDQMILKPQQNLEKFNRITQELLSPQPAAQKILRRRNTMVVFDSAPLVDKEKLKRANALLFEDVQEEEKRKRKEAEEERLNARRNKVLEEMFKRTDDNCTVSTQNIISGKRRTRATINFNETANAINVFKHKAVKDTAAATATANAALVPTVTAPIGKTTRSNFKIKLKNLKKSFNNKATKEELSDEENDDEDDDEPLVRIKQKETKTKHVLKPKQELNATKAKTPKVADQFKAENQTDEAEMETKKPTNTIIVRKISRNNEKDKQEEEIKFKATLENEEHQNCAVSSTSTDNDNNNVEETTCSSTSTHKSFKKETSHNDNEPTSTGSKSNNPTPTPEPNEPALQEIVDQILKPNSNREPIFAILAQILSEEKLALIKSLIESRCKQNEEDDEEEEEEKTTKPGGRRRRKSAGKRKSAKQKSRNGNRGKMKTAVEEEEEREEKEEEVEEEEEEQEEEEEEEEHEHDQERKPILRNRVGAEKKIIVPPKKKRSELDRLNEDIRDMFICNGVLTATGRRMCTMMGKDIPTTNITTTPTNNKKKPDLLKPPNARTRALRRSNRSYKTTDDNEDNESVLSGTTEDSNDDCNSHKENTEGTTDTTPVRKMPVLKPHTPIKIPDEEVAAKAAKPTTKEMGHKRKADSKAAVKAKKSKTNKEEETKEDTESEGNDSEVEAETNEVEVEAEEIPTQKKETVWKNTNLHWHNQSKYATWCMICEKRLPPYVSSLHYKTFHRENYISRMAPVLLQQYKQGKLSQPLFGVKKAQKQATWFYRCPFCLKYLNITLQQWLQHFQNHTIELLYECSKCYRSNNRKLNVQRHLKKCEEGASVLTVPVKLNVPTIINVHVCHLCNFIQLKRDNLERHYIEQHHLAKKTVDLLGYTLKLFDVDQVECVSEEKAAEKEKEVWQSIEKNEQVIDIDDDDVLSSNDNDTEGPKETATLNEEESAAKETTEVEINESAIAANNSFKEGTGQNKDKEDKMEETNKPLLRKANKMPTKPLNNVQEEKDKECNKTPKEQEKLTTKQQKKKDKTQHLVDNKNLSDMNSNDFEVVDPEVTVQDIQDELLTLAAKAAEEEDDSETPNTLSHNNNRQNATTMQTTTPTILNTREEPNLTTSQNSETQPKTTMSDIISRSIDMLYRRDSTSSEAKRMSQTASNVFMPTREESNSSPTIQILAQSIINIDVQENQALHKEKPITMAERLSQRFKNLQADSCTATKPVTNLSQNTTNGNAFEKLLDDTLFELTKEKNCANSKQTAPITPAVVTEVRRENVFDRLFNDTVLELDKDDVVHQNTRAEGALMQQQQQEPELVVVPATLTINASYRNDLDPLEIRPPQELAQQIAKDLPRPAAAAVTVISDDEDWEDIEITETAPSTVSSTTSTGNASKTTKSKGLFQKFGGLFKGNNSKSKKLLTPMAFMPKKKTTKEKPSPANAPATPSSITAPATVPTPVQAIMVHNHNSNANSTKPVNNIMDGLFPDSPCNDPIDLVPELAPLEPLQDLNDISSILDSNLSAVNINAADNHTSIEDALDFVSEQQAHDKQQQQKLQPSSSSFALTASQAKTTTINNISHVGYSLQTAGESGFKFYCLLQNCPFLYSNDLIGLETHFMCEHSQIKWNGYCLMCQAQCFPNHAEDISGGYTISKEIRHMMEKHAHKPILDLNTDSTQTSNCSSSHDTEERPKIKLRRLTGDCLSRTTPENVPPASHEMVPAEVPTTTPLTMLGALLVADPRPPTKEMPPQPEMPLTEPLLLHGSAEANSSLPAFRNVNSDFLITSVTSAAATAAAKPQNQHPLQISSVVSLNNKTTLPAVGTDAATTIQLPKISNVRTLAPKAGALWTQQIENERLELAEAATESLEVSRILHNANKTATTNRRSSTRTENDSPVLLVDDCPLLNLPIAQSKTGEFVLTQTLSAQYNEFSSAALGFNISIAVSSTEDNSNSATLPAGGSSTTSAAAAATSGGANSAAAGASVASRQYKCMGAGCKFVSRVPVAMSDHLRFHERRNFSHKQDYLACGFCFYCATDVDDYMKHANQFHIINKSGPSSGGESETANSLTKKINNILNNKKGGGGSSSQQLKCLTSQASVTKQVQQDPQEVYIRKLKNTIKEIVRPTGLAENKLYRCVVKNCHSPLTETTFLTHIMFHITATGANPNNYLFKCPHCNAQYHRAAGIKAHIKNHARNRYFCYLCDETSTNPGQMLKHFSDKHWHTMNMFTKELLPPKVSKNDGSDSVPDSNYYVAYSHELRAEEVRLFGEKLILEWQRKKAGSKTHFKSSEIDLLPLSAIFQRQVNCGECEYKTKVRTNMFRHLLMHKQNPGLAHEVGAASVVDPVNPVPCLNSNERFFDKMTNLASSSLIPSSSSSAAAAATSSAPTKPPFNLPQAYVDESKRFVCGCTGCNYHTISDDLFRVHMTTVHSTEMLFTCPFCKEEVCRRGIAIDRILNHTRFHGNMLYRCDECNYYHYLRYVVERHVNDKHSTLKVNIVTHSRSPDDCVNGTITSAPFAGKRYNPFEEQHQTQQPVNSPVTRATNNESSTPKPNTVAPITNPKGKGKWECDVCGHKSVTVSQIQMHCQQQHSVKNQYKCAHCNFGSQQLAQILHHIDEKHDGKTREAHTMYHKVCGNNEEVAADTRPLWQRNDPTRVRHIRGILMEDEDESEEYRKQLALSEEADNDSNADDDHDDDDQPIEVEDNEEPNAGTYINGYEFGCYHCSFKTQRFEDLRDQHYNQNHNCQVETAKPFWYRLYRRLCCPECRSFLGNCNEMQQHLHNKHNKQRFFAADIKMAEIDDTSHRILCGYCSFHCANAEQLYKHHLKAQHWPQDIRLDNNDQIMEILALGKPQVSYQCTLCADIFANRVAIIQHACDAHGGEDSFSMRELSNSLIYRCNSCYFTSTTEMELLRHAIDHYSRFKVCSFCQAEQTSFNGCMQHCYEQHKNKIDKFRSTYLFEDIKKFLLQTLVVFPTGLVLNKRNLLNTQYGKSFAIYNLYEEIYKISQQPPIPRLSIARLVARKSIEAQQTGQPQPKPISKRRCTVAFEHESNHSNDSSSSNSNRSLLKPKLTISEGKSQSLLLPLQRRRTTADQAAQVLAKPKLEEFSAPLRANKISKRRSTVAVDHDTLFCHNLSDLQLPVAGKKRKSSVTHMPPSSSSSSPKYAKEMYTLHGDTEPYSFYGKTPEVLDLSKIYTKVAIGGIKTPLTIDKFKLLFNIDCRLSIPKCDADGQLLQMANYTDYKHIRKACPASAKLRYD